MARTPLEEFFLEAARKLATTMSAKETAVEPVTFEAAQGLYAVSDEDWKNWTPQEEEDLQERWNQSPLKRVIADHSKKGREAYGEILALWKYTIQSYGCLPTSIIGGGYSLCVDASNSLQSKLNDSPLWSAPFCKALVRIMAHPIFFNQPRQGGGNAGALATTLQLAVIARTADSRPWRIRWVGMDPFVHILEREMRVLDQETPGAKTNCWHIVARATAIMEFQSPFALLFALIVGSYKERNPIPGAESVVTKPYVVTPQDLTCVEAALDGLMDCVGAYQFTVGGYYTLAMEGKKLGKGKYKPTAPAAGQLHTLLAGGVVASWREGVIWARVAAGAKQRPPPTGLEGSEGGDDEWGGEPTEGPGGPPDECPAWFLSALEKPENMGPVLPLTPPLEEDRLIDDGLGHRRGRTSWYSMATWSRW